MKQLFVLEARRPLGAHVAGGIQCICFLLLYPEDGGQAINPW